MPSRNARSFQRKSGRESGMKGTRSRKPLELLSHCSPPSSLPTSLTLSPFGTFNGVKLWACKSNNNCLGLKHNTLTGVTRPFSPPPLALRRDHLLLFLWSQPQWQRIVDTRHFLCHYLLTAWVFLYRRITKNISLKLFHKKSLLIETLIHPEVNSIM